MKYIGVDIGGTQVKIGIVDENGVVSKSMAYDVAFDGYETPIIETVVSSLAEFMKFNKLEESQINGIGVSSTGLIDPIEGRVVASAGHLKAWAGCNIREKIGHVYRGPVTVMNDANCAALAEHWIGGAKDYSDAVVLTIGTGIGGGIISNSEVICGTAGGAGEIGHITIRNNGRRCCCGNIGCYEQYASATALIRMVTKAQKDGKLDQGLFVQHKIDGRSVFEAVGKDVNLDAILAKWIGYVADGIISLIHTLSPQVVLVGGGVSTQKEKFIDPLRKKVLSQVMPVYAGAVKLEAASLGNDAGMVGAVYYCRKHSI